MLSEIMKLADFRDTRDLIMKVDIEGAEWAAFSSVQSSELEPFQQMIFEFHNIEELCVDSTAVEITATLKKFYSSHLPIHIHANNYDGLVRFNDYWFPSSLEVTYLRRDLAADPQPDPRVGCDADSPCDPRVAEIFLESIASVGIY